MKPEGASGVDASWLEAASQLQHAAQAAKCWKCGCLHGTLAAIDGTPALSDPPTPWTQAMAAARSRLEPMKYDCLGCRTCFPALASNALASALGEASLDSGCVVEPARERKGWPPLPGSYTALRYRAPVAICTLTDSNLCERIRQASPTQASLVGTLQTENLGIERLLVNVLANPHIRFVLLCGSDSQQAVGHLPGQSLVALARHGLDSRSRIVGARGKRPFLKNVNAAAVEHFRRTVEIVDLISTDDLPTILGAVEQCGAANPRPAEPFAAERVIPVSRGYLPNRVIPDPRGYFVVFVDRTGHCLLLEHYRTDGVLDSILQGQSPAEIYVAAIEQGLVSRLDHAAYLGCELARAHVALRTGDPYVQDAALERPALAVAATCGCASSCSPVR